MAKKKDEIEMTEQEKDKAEAKKKQEERKNRKKTSFYRLFRYATPFDWLLLIIGTFAAMAGISFTLKKTSHRIF